MLDQSATPPTDELTGLRNRSALNDLIALAEFAQARNQPFALLLLDVDNLKLFNDWCGHNEGDALLVAIARVLQRSVSGQETALRLGGDEFLLALPGATIDEAHARAVALCEEIEKIETGSADAPHASVSIGVAAAPKAVAWTLREMIALADVRMYNSKIAARGSVCARDLDSASHRLIADAWPEFRPQASVDALTGIHDSRGMREALLSWGLTELHDRQSGTVNAPDVDRRVRALMVLRVVPEIAERVDRGDFEHFLAQMTSALKVTCRSGQLLWRSGIDELAVFTRDTPIATMRVASDLLSTLYGRLIASGAGAVPKVTLACGVAGGPQYLSSSITFLDRARARCERALSLGHALCASDDDQALPLGAAVWPQWTTPDGLIDRNHTAPARTISVEFPAWVRPSPGRAAQVDTAEVLTALSKHVRLEVVNGYVGYADLRVTERAISDRLDAMTMVLAMPGDDWDDDLDISVPRACIHLDLHVMFEITTEDQAVVDDKVETARSILDELFASIARACDCDGGVGPASKSRI